MFERKQQKNHGPNNIHHVLLFILTHIYSIHIWLLHITSYTISVPPMIWVPEQLISVYSGESVRLTCVVEAHPASLNYWEKVNKQFLFVLYCC